MSIILSIDYYSRVKDSIPKFTVYPVLGGFFTPEILTPISDPIIYMINLCLL